MFVATRRRRLRRMALRALAVAAAASVPLAAAGEEPVHFLHDDAPPSSPPAASTVPEGVDGEVAPRSGGVALSTIGGVSGSAGLQAAYGLHAAVARQFWGHTRLGLALVASKDAGDSGVAGRAGALIGRGAPWGNELLGFELEAGVQAIHLSGYAYPPGGVVPREGILIDVAGTPPSVACAECGGTATRWTSIAPYVEGSILIQTALRSAPFHLFGGPSLVWGTDYRGNSSLLVSAQIGVAWQGW
jgi:hypothetical protein